MGDGKMSINRRREILSVNQHVERIQRYDPSTVSLQPQSPISSLKVKRNRCQNTLTSANTLAKVRSDIKHIAEYAPRIDICLESEFVERDVLVGTVHVPACC